MENAGLSIIEKMGGWMFEPIQRELGYFLCFNSNIQELQTRLDQLKATRNDVQGREEAAKRMWQTLGEATVKWIENADEKIEEAERVLNDTAQLQRGCFSIKWCHNLILRFSLGRKGKKSSLVLIELLQSGGQLPHTGYALPMPSINMRDYSGDACDFESRSQIMEDIIEMLRDKETMLIGICGMGGIGKTTFAKQVLQKVKDYHKNLFEILVITTVSSSPNFNAIQQEVAQMLGSSLKHVDGEILRAERLRNVFSNKKVVVLLDDVWKEFDLNALGFPLRKSDVGGCCKIIYTSRTQSLWSGERTISKKEFSLNVLSPEEALNLFKRKVNLSDDDIEFHSKNEKARQIVDECKGLPLVLGVVGGALIEKEKHAWENMGYQLRNHGQDQNTDQINKVLETSYHSLEDPNAKFLFLLCCLFREDEEILVGTLCRYVVGLQLFKGGFKRIKDRVYTLLDDLIKRNLILKIESLFHKSRVVKMHDVMRDVGISIAKQDNNFSFLLCDGVREQENIVSPHTNTKMISIMFRNEDLTVADKLEFSSNLELLRLDSSNIYPSNTKISTNFFKGADNLKVLDIVGNMISEFPYSPSFLCLANLKMLSLHGLNLDIITNASSIGHIKCLEILSIRWSIMKTLPNKIRELTNLRLLDLTGCECFISKDVLSKLTNLEELYMWASFKDWRQRTDGDNNAAAKLTELDSLHKLSRLELEIANIEQVPRGARLFSSLTLLKQFKIIIGEGNYGSSIRFERGERQLGLKNVKDNISFFNELEFLIEKGITNLYLCHDSVMWEQMHLNIFLNDIVLKHCGSLRHIISDEEESNIGRYLRRIEIYDCNQMSHLCSTSISKHLTNLQVLILQKCEMTEEVISNICDETEQLNKIEFNALETLKLYDLSRLKCFCKRINEIHFQNLKTLELKGLKQFIFPAKLEIPCLEELSIVSIPNIETLCDIVSPSLQKLEIDSCENIKCVVFSYSFMMMIICHLRSLTIKNCERLKGVIGVTTDAEEQREKLIEFPNLSTLKLKSLVELAGFIIDVDNLDDKEEQSQNALFYHDDDQVSFPSLQELNIYGLPKITYIVRRKERLGHHHDDIENREIQPRILFFPNLKISKLGDLEELLSFVGLMNNMDNNCKNENALFHPDDEVSFPCLYRLVINGLPKINYIIGWKEVEGDHHRDLFPVLSELVLNKLSNLIHIYEINKPEEIGVLLFQNMKELIIGECEKLRYLFSENISRKAAKNLEMLSLNGCPMMEVVIKKEEELTEDDDKDGGGSNSFGNTQFFPLLQTLSLWDLSSLRSFFDIDYPWALPLLEYLYVLRCPELEALSPGYLDSPRLDHLFYDNRKQQDIKKTLKGDINKALCHLFIKTQTEAQSGETREQ